MVQPGDPLDHYLAAPEKRADPAPVVTTIDFLYLVTFGGKVMNDTAMLLGTWKMISWKREIVATGEKTDALGPNPTGYINVGQTVASMRSLSAEIERCRQLYRQATVRS